jgi:PrgI family protein
VKTLSERVRIPADIDQPDRILAGLTARQLLILVVAALPAALVLLLAGPLLPLPLAAALAAPPLLAGVALALGRRDGIGLDRLAVAALRQHLAPRLLVPAPDGVVPPSAWHAPAASGQAPGAPLRLAARDIAADGVIDLGPGGAALVCEASTVNFALRTPTEQQALISAFARALHALTAPVQVLVRVERADLTTHVRQLRQVAGGLPHPALEAAARQHASFLADLTERRDVLRRQTLLVLHDPAPPANAAQGLRRGADDLGGLLGACGITLTPLDTAQAAAALARACDPEAPPAPAGRAAPGDIIYGANP